MNGRGIEYGLAGLSWDKQDIKQITDIIKPNGSGRLMQEMTWEMINGDVATLTGSPSKFAFPAAAGYEHLDFTTDALLSDEEIDAFDVLASTQRLPVLGWAACFDKARREFVEPLTFDRSLLYGTVRAHGVLLPDGRVVSLTNKERVYESLDAWIAGVKSVWKKIAKDHRDRAEKQKPCPQCGRKHSDFDDEIPF